MSDSPHVDPEDATLSAAIDRLLGVDFPSRSHLGLVTTHDSPEIQTVGRLEDIEFVRLIGLAFVSAHSGTLVIRSRFGEATIWWAAGLPEDVALPDATESDRATAGAHDVERWLFEITAWTAGTFVFSTEGADRGHRVHPLRHPVVLTYEVLQRRSDVSALERWRGDRRNRFLLRWPFAGQVLANLPLDLRNTLRLFDGGRSFAEVQRGTRCDESILLRAVYLLFCFGALDLGREDAPPISSLSVADRTDRGRIEALFGLAEESDYFAFLGVDRMSSPYELVQAMARVGRAIGDHDLHPDVALATGKQRSIIAAVLEEARRVLLDEDLRLRYRAALAPEP